MSGMPAIGRDKRTIERTPIRQVGWVLGFLAMSILFCSSPVVAVEGAFRSDEEFGQWFTHYYRNPQPEQAPHAFRYYLTSPLSKKPQSVMMTSVFFAELFKNDPAVMQQVYDETIGAESSEARLVLFQTLWLTNTPQSKALLEMARSHRLSQKMRDTITEMLSQRPDDILALPIREGGHLDQLWARFFATGDAAPVQKIISALAMTADSSKPDYVIGAAAQWSLSSNAAQHERVYAICQEEAGRQNGSIAEVLSTIVKEAEREKTW